MWWIPATIATSYVIKKLVKENKRQSYTSTYTPTLTTLELNLRRLSIELKQHDGKMKIAILGQPGSGKSTMLDILTEYQCDPRPKIGQQTDATDWSNDLQVNLLNLYKDKVFVDVPGFNTFSHPVESFVDYFPFQDFDRLLFVIKGKVYEGDNQIWKEIRSRSFVNKTLIVRTFSDTLTEEEEKEMRTDLTSQFGRDLVTVSSRYKTGFGDILYFLKNN